MLASQEEQSLYSLSILIVSLEFCPSPAWCSSTAEMSPLLAAGGPHLRVSTGLFSVGLLQIKLSGASCFIRTPLSHTHLGAGWLGHAIGLCYVLQSQGLCFYPLSIVLWKGKGLIFVKSILLISSLFWMCCFSSVSKESLYSPESYSMAFCSWSCVFLPATFYDFDPLELILICGYSMRYEVFFCAWCSIVPATFLKKVIHIIAFYVFEENQLIVLDSLFFSIVLFI